MARSFSSSKVLSSAIASAINGRCFSSAAPQLIRGGAAPVRSAAAAKKEVVHTEKVAWVPDPRTGCYRPENVANEIDAAELRALLLKKN